MTSEAERIAEELTEAQRWCLCDHRPYRGLADQGWLESTRDARSFQQAGRLLMTRHLVAWPDNPTDSRTKLTPLGLEVKRILEEKG